MFLGVLGTIRAPQHTFSLNTVYTQNEPGTTNQGTTGTISAKQAKTGTIKQKGESPQTLVFRGFHGGRGGIRTHAALRLTAFRDKSYH